MQPPVGSVMREAAFSRELIRLIREQTGKPAIKTNDKVTRGLPDIYVPSGRWIESKIIPSLPSERNYPLKYFTMIQRDMLDMLTSHGDRCFAAVYWHFTIDDRAIMVMPWYYFRRIRIWDLATVQHFSHPVLPRQFDFPVAEMWREGVFEEKWRGWPHNQNARRYDRDYTPPTLADAEPAEA